ncbi:MAG: glycosyltransferase 87 family protein [Candidatus Thorarchaeota archaeon]
MESSSEFQRDYSQVLGRISRKRDRMILTIAVVLNVIPPLLLRFVGGAMYPFFIVVALWSALYIVTLALALHLKKQSVESPLFGVSEKRSFMILLIITVVPRLAWVGSGVIISLDALWYIDFGKFMSWGDMPYADFYFPYPPVFGYFIFAIMIVAPSIDSYKILAILFDVAIVVILWEMTRRKVIRDVKTVVPFAYAILPFSIIESGLNGHFEPIANLLLLISIWCILEQRHGWSGVFLGLSAATKVYTGFLLPLFLLMIAEHRKKAEFISAAVITGYLTFIPFSVPVWLRGDLLLPGTAMPGLETGFFDALIGFIFGLGPFHLLAIALVAGSAIILIIFFMLKSFAESRIRTATTYDVVTASIGVLLAIMTLLAWVYPFLPPGPGVYWRYPVDIALARGAGTAIGAMLIIWTSWKRLRNNPLRPTANVQLILVASVLLMLLLTLSKQVFYGWYLLWVLPPLLVIRDRRLVYLLLACMLLIYPSYTHDNFQSLGYDEVETWSDDFSDTSDWAITMDLTNTSLDASDVSATVESVNGVGAFSMSASGVSDESELEQIEIVWSKNASIPITSATEVVILISADWDPTFEKYCQMGFYFDGLNATGHSVSWPLIAPWQFSPSNITYVLWRFTFSGQDIQVYPVELTRFRLVINDIRQNELTIFIDTMYSTEVVLLSVPSTAFAAMLALPNAIALLVLHRALPRHDSWYMQEATREAKA